MKVLVVGDTPRWIDTVRKSLPTQAEVCTRNNVADVYTLFTEQEEIFDLCIFASRIQEVDDGLSLLFEMQKSEPEADLHPRSEPVIICSNLLPRSSVEAALAAGAIVVPWNESDAAELTKAVNEVLGLE